MKGLMLSRKKNLNPQGEVDLGHEATQRNAKGKFFGLVLSNSILIQVKCGLLTGGGQPLDTR